LENRRGQDDKVSRGVWETVEASIREIRVGKTEKRRSKGRSGEEKRGKGKEEEIEKGKNSGSKESSRRVGDMG